MVRPKRFELLTLRFVDAERKSVACYTKVT